jgi:mRNA deadenylase 3'-5' endonuclease subunit Ccr4
MTGGAVNDDRIAEEWNELQRFCWGKGEAVVAEPSTVAQDSVDDTGGMTLSSQFVDPASLPVLKHGLRLVSAAGYPQFTNYTAEFRNLLDYIFVEDNRFEVLRVAPFPSEQVLAERTALPSAVFPSDHIAVAVDIRFR